MDNVTYNNFKDGCDLYNYALGKFNSSKCELKDTVEGMNSDNYVDREFAEYQQLTIRLTKLRNFIKKYENSELDFKPSCSIGMLKAQESAMSLYKYILEERFLEECKKILNK